MTDTAAEYIRANFPLTDRLAVVLIQKHTGGVVQRIASAERIVQQDAQKWLHQMNSQRFEVYLSMNRLAEDATTRQKPSVVEIRHIYCEFDHHATERVQALRGLDDIPTPNHIIESSPGRFQVIWRVQGFEKDQAEQLMRGMVRELGADPACTDCSRVLRLPGFVNHKYAEPHLVTVQNLTDKVYRPESYPEFAKESSRAYIAERTGTKRVDGAPISQSERDWAYAKSHLARGDDPEKVTRAIAEYRSRDNKHSDPHSYASRTVARALRQLNECERTR